MEIDRYMRCVLQDVPMFNTNIDINFDDKLMKLLSGRYIDFINAERFLIMNCCKNIKKKYNNVIFKIQYDIKNDIWLIYFSNEYRYDQNFKKYIYKYLKNI